MIRQVQIFRQEKEQTPDIVLVRIIITFPSPNKQERMRGIQVFFYYTEYTTYHFIILVDINNEQGIKIARIE